MKKEIVSIFKSNHKSYNGPTFRINDILYAAYCITEGVEFLYTEKENGNIYYVFKEPSIYTLLYIGEKFDYERNIIINNIRALMELLLQGILSYDE
jgi:hypothetical protein